MPGIDKNFLDSFVWRFEFLILGIVEKKHIFVFVIHFKKMTGQLKNIPSDTGESG
jgi:hypothetical protein